MICVPFDDWIGTFPPSQSYQEGWPLTPPLLTDELESPIGVMIAGSLSERWFEDLPFSPNSVEAMIPEKVKPRIQIKWHDRDVIFSERAFPLDRSSQALSRWLNVSE